MNEKQRLHSGQILKIPFFCLTSTLLSKRRNWPTDWQSTSSSSRLALRRRYFFQALFPSRIFLIALRREKNKESDRPSGCFLIGRRANERTNFDLRFSRNPVFLIRKCHRPPGTTPSLGHRFQIPRNPVFLIALSTRPWAQFPVWVELWYI